MSTLLNVSITTAQTAAVGQVLTYSEFDITRSACIQGNFIYGSGGTSADFYVQTSLDQGTTWCDVAEFHLTTSSSRSIYNLSSLTPKTTAVTPTDGSLTSNTAVDGVMGSQWRAKYTTVGTYVNTIMVISIISDRLTIP